MPSSYAEKRLMTAARRRVWNASSNSASSTSRKSGSGMAKTRRGNARARSIGAVPVAKTRIRIAMGARFTPRGTPSGFGGGEARRLGVIRAVARSRQVRAGGLTYSSSLPLVLLRGSTGVS